MRKVLKSSNITIDSDNRVNIEVMHPSAFVPEEEPVSTAEFGDESDEISEEDILNRARKDAEDILENARREADNITRDMNAQAEKLAKEVREKSRAQGYEEGYAQGVEEAEGIKEEARRIHEQAIAQSEEMINSVEGDMVELVISVVNKLVAAEVNINPQIVMNLIKQGLSGATLSGEVFIHVSQEDYDYVVKHKDEMFLFTDSSAKLEIVKDMSLNKLDCIIETPFGNIDCSLNQQAGELKKDLYYILENR